MNAAQDNIKKKSMTNRTWIVVVTVRSAVRLKEDKLLNIIATPESTVPLSSVRIRNHVVMSTDKKPFVNGLTVEAAGSFNNKEDAVATLGNIAMSYFHIVALAANSAIDEEVSLLVYAPPLAEEEGEFASQHHCDLKSPTCAVRQIDAGDLMSVLQAMNSHKRKDRLHRAMAHYRMAVSHIAPFNRILAAESLFIACENLTKVISQRLLKEAQLKDISISKHDLAVANGFDPVSEKSSQHLNNFDSWIRKTYIFNGDTECYNKLKKASDDFEHGISDLSKILKYIDSVTDLAFGYIRQSILSELGLSKTSELFNKRFDVPLANYSPLVQVEGTYKDPTTVSGPGFTAEGLHDEWPQFLGVNLFPQISVIDDLPNGTRNVSVSATLNGNSLLPKQTVSQITKMSLVYPKTEETNATVRGEPIITLTNNDLLP
jgi:hypothetical protein